MPFDANLGQTSASNVSPVNLTTTAAAAVGAHVVVLISYFGGAASITGVTVGGTAATSRKAVTNGSDKFEIWSVDKAAGMASASTIAVTFAGGAGGQLVGALSLTGVNSGAPVVTTGSATGTGTAWSSGAATNTAVPDAIYVGGAGNEDATNPTSSTATSGVEVNDLYDVADGQGFATGYKIVTSVASDAVTGNFSNANSTANTGALVIFDVAPGAAAASPPSIPCRMPLGL